MRKLETYVNEKLRVNKTSAIPDLITLVGSKNRKDFEYRYKQFAEYLKYDSDLPAAELEYRNKDVKRISRKHENQYDIFLAVLENVIFYGAWDNMYYICWDKGKRHAKNINFRDKFSEFIVSDDEIPEYGGVYIITENKELVNQINYLMQTAESLV